MFEVVEHAGGLVKTSPLLICQGLLSLLGLFAGIHLFMYFHVILVYQLLARTIKVRSRTWHVLHDGLCIELVLDGIQILHADIIVHLGVLRSSIHLDYNKSKDKYINRCKFEMDIYRVVVGARQIRAEIAYQDREGRVFWTAC